MGIIESLESTKSKALQFFDLPESALVKSYGEGKWNVKEILCHIADSETVLYDRVRRIIAEPKQVIWVYDQDLWRDNLDYQNFPLSIQKNIFETIRNAIIYLAGKYYTSHADKEFVHSETGIRTLKDEFDKVCSHCEHHLQQIETAIAQ
jgi:hypothetical protein